MELPFSEEMHTKRTFPQAIEEILGDPPLAEGLLTPKSFDSRPYARPGGAFPTFARRRAPARVWRGETHALRLSTRLYRA
jgi:hypothetical protein